MSRATNCQNEMKKAVEAGYWNLFTFNPANKAQGKNPFTLTSKAVDNDKYQALLANETRYSRLTRAFPDRAKELFARNQQVANDRYEHWTRLVDPGRIILYPPGRSHGGTQLPQMRGASAPHWRLLRNAAVRNCVYGP